MSAWAIIARMSHPVRAADCASTVGHRPAPTVGHRFASVAAGGTGALCALLLATASPARVHAQSATEADNPFSMAPPTHLPYDREYPVMHYERMPQENRIARLQQRLDAGTIALDFTPGHGYLQSLLKALDIDPSSQVLVYSKTSLQKGDITAATPRAIYFNDDTYVGWVQHSDVVELGAMDSRLGQVFYTLENRAGGAHLQRQIMNCLSCHDTYELSGGGVPRFLLMSTYVDVLGNQLTHEDSILVDDQTPIKFRWGGWYVTGHTGSQVHVGNIQVHTVQELVHLDQVRRGNIDNLDALFNTKPYLTDKSDVVALMVLQHQVTVQNLITRANFEVRTALSRAGVAARDIDHSRAQLPPKVASQLDGFLDDLVKGMLFVDAAAITDTIRGNSGFDAWFQAQGPRDASGRSLRALDLRTRLFRYPLSYLVYSPAFNALPDYAKDYVYGRIAAVLAGADTGLQPALTADERSAISGILAATKPDYVAYVALHSSGASH